MRDFFKPWRRKFGVVTLGLACVFAAGWTRSLIIMDVVEFFVNSHSNITLLSADHSLGVQYVYSHVPQNLPSFPGWLTRDSGILESVLAKSGVTWHFRFGGFGAGEDASLILNGDRCDIWLVPYWSIALPLTLLSAWLLLSKPRPGKMANQIATGT